MAHPEVQNGAAAELSAPVITFTAVKTQLLVGAPKANDAVNFYKAAFGAEEVSRALDPKRKADQDQQFLRYAELKLAGFTIFVSDSADSEKSATGNNGIMVLCLETENVEAAIAKAVSAGGFAEGEIADEGENACCGERVGKVKDPYGFLWLICSSAKKCDEAEA